MRQVRYCGMYVIFLITFQVYVLSGDALGDSIVLVLSALFTLVSFELVHTLSLLCAYRFFQNVAEAGRMYRRQMYCPEDFCAVDELTSLQAILLSSLNSFGLTGTLP